MLLSDQVCTSWARNPAGWSRSSTLDLPRPRKLSMITGNKFIEYRQYWKTAIGEIDLSKIK